MTFCMISATVASVIVLWRLAKPTGGGEPAGLSLFYFKRFVKEFLSDSQKIHKEAALFPSTLKQKIQGGNLKKSDFCPVRHLRCLHLLNLISEHTLDFVAHGLPADLAEMYPDNIGRFPNLLYQHGYVLCFMQVWGMSVHYQIQYSNVPLWATANILTFGSLYANTAIKNAIPETGRPLRCPPAPACRE